MPWWPDDRLTGAEAGGDGAEAAFPEDNGGGEVFTCVAGDTVGFERELFWYAAPDDAAEPGTTREAIAYAMELVRASDSARLALIDSIDILPDYAPGRAGVHGPHPLHAIIRFAVPAELGGERAFMRLRPSHHGDTHLRWWARSEREAPVASARPDPVARSGRANAPGPDGPFRDTLLLQALSSHGSTSPRLEVAVSTRRPYRATVLFAPTAAGDHALSLNAKNEKQDFTRRSVSRQAGVRPRRTLFHKGRPGHC